jgi:THO complex subunit 5
MYPLEQFIELSPPEAHSEDVLSNEHQLVLNRLGFELVERQRFRGFSHRLLLLTHMLMLTFARPPDLTEGPKSSHKRRKTYLRPQNPKLPRPKV